MRRILTTVVLALMAIAAVPVLGTFATSAVDECQELATFNELDITFDSAYKFEVSSATAVVGEPVPGQWEGTAPNITLIVTEVKDGEVRAFSWTSTDGTTYEYVLVKAGNDELGDYANYSATEYEAGATSGTEESPTYVDGGETKEPGVSHITWCDGTFNTTTTTTEDPSTSTTSTTVVEPSNDDLTVDVDGDATYTRTHEWEIDKSSPTTLVKKVGGSTLVSYTVTVDTDGFTDGDWAVAGTIEVTNPNDEPIGPVDVTVDSDNGGDCAVTGGDDVTIGASDTDSFDYACTYTANPGLDTITGTATWDAGDNDTPSGSADDNTVVEFSGPTTTVNGEVSVTDSLDGAPATSLGTVTLAEAPKELTYTRSISVPAFGCVTHTNEAEIVETGDDDSWSVDVCGPLRTGAHTMGFWQNKNGQAIIATPVAPAADCSLTAAYLNSLTPLKTAPNACKQLASYVGGIIKSASASGASMNAMLKGQMLATALSVWFSESPHNYLFAPVSLGGVAIDLTYVCKDIAACTIFRDVSAAFGGASSMTVSQMLAFASSAPQYVAGPPVSWYGQVKATQELAKDAFDAINNRVAFGA